ncbi:hypothetical protein, partial [Enterobacter cloacae]|uniref:hypothetical protein n=1 Tax=Enterobacter cloacae TaxID=550 RepID=UPI002004C866
TGGTADRNRSHWSTSKTPSYTKSVSWQHHPVTLPTSFPNGILGTGVSFYGSGGNNSDSYYMCTPVNKNQVKIQTRNCNGTFSLIVSGY